MASAPLAASATPPSAPEKIIVPYGTILAVRLTESLSSDLNEKGDTFLASLASPILVGDRVVIPEGAGIKGRVVEVQSAGRFSGRPAMIIEVTRLAYNGNGYDLRSNQYSKEVLRGTSAQRRRLVEVQDWARFSAGSLVEERELPSVP